MCIRTFTRCAGIKIISLMLFFVACLLPATGSADTTGLALIYQQDKSFSVAIARNLQQRFAADNRQLTLIPLNTINDDNLRALSPNTLIISLGSETTQELFQHRRPNPVISLLIPKQAYRTLLQQKPPNVRWTAVYIDQPLSRQLALIRHLLGPDKKVGVLLGPYSEAEKSSLQSAARSSRQQLEIQKINDQDQLIPALNMLTDHSDVLLALPDPTVFNKTTIRGILLLSYRKNIPMIGFSRAYVKAGAIAALYTDLDQISEQAYRLTLRFLKTGGLPRSSYYPDAFSVELNYKVARTLNLDLKDEQTLIELINKGEVGR